MAEDQADGVIGDILVIGVPRMADLEAARCRPGYVDPVIAHGEAGDQAERGHLLDQIAGDRELARGDHRAHLAEPAQRRLLPQRQGFVEAGEQRDQRPKMWLGDSDDGGGNGAIGHGPLRTQS